MDRLIAATRETLLILNDCEYVIGPPPTQNLL